MVNSHCNNRQTNQQIYCMLNYTFKLVYWLLLATNSREDYCWTPLFIVTPSLLNQTKVFPVDSVVIYPDEKWEQDVMVKLVVDFLTYFSHPDRPSQRKLWGTGVNKNNNFLVDFKGVFTPIVHLFWSESVVVFCLVRFLFTQRKI